MNGRKAVRVDEREGKSKTGMITARKVSREKEPRKKWKTEKAAMPGSQQPGRYKQKATLGQWLSGIENKKRTYERRHLKEKNKTQIKGDDVVVCLPGAMIEHVTERIENV